MTTATNEPPVFAEELKALLGVTQPTVAKWIAAGRIPPPDVRLNKRKRYWHRMTLRKVGLLPPVDYPATPAVNVEFPKAPKRPPAPTTDSQAQVWMVEAKNAGLTWIKKTRPKFCLYTFDECSHTQEIGYKDVRTNAFVCHVCGASWATRPSSLYVHLITLQGEQLIKVGISKVINRRIAEYGLPPDATVQTLFTGSFATGKAASDAESQLLQKFKSHRLKNVEHIMQKSGSTECLCPTVIRDVVATAKSLSGAEHQGAFV